MCVCVCICVCVYSVSVQALMRCTMSWPVEWDLPGSQNRGRWLECKSSPAAVWPLLLLLCFFVFVYVCPHYLSRIIHTHTHTSKRPSLRSGLLPFKPFDLGEKTYAFFITIEIPHDRISSKRVLGLIEVRFGPWTYTNMDGKRSEAIKMETSYYSSSSKRTQQEYDLRSILKSKWKSQSRLAVWGPSLRFMGGHFQCGTATRCSHKEINIWRVLPSIPVRFWNLLA